jgi:hypothetical protein
MGSTNSKMLEILVGMVRLELKSPEVNNENPFQVNKGNDTETCGELGDIVKSGMRPKNNKSKTAETTAILNNISTVILSDDDKSEPDGHIQFGTVPYKEYTRTKKNTPFNDKGKSPLAFDCDQFIQQNTAPNMLGSNFKRSHSEVSNISLICNLIFK